ncbi:MAG: trypsin-like serine protease [Rhodobacteraceae bacterium]|nr:trypsin-like serine protease [Paracoccaceae bacterium]
MALVIATPGHTENSRLRSLITGDDGRGWEGVGRLNIGTRSFCTGAMVAENLVLTAGHCLFDDDTGQRIDAGEIEFLAGWRSGRASAYRGVRRVIVHPGFEFASTNTEHRVRYDLALLELDQPIRSGSIQPFATHSQPAKGAAVGVVSYAHDRAESPSLQESCNVLARQSGTLVLSCKVDYGSSGAPVFVFENGVAQIVSVVSAKAMARDIPVSLGTSLEGPLSDMMAMLAENDGVFGLSVPVVQIISPTGSTSSGAKFLRP